MERRVTREGHGWYVGCHLDGIGTIAPREQNGCRRGRCRVFGVFWGQRSEVSRLSADTAASAIHFTVTMTGGLRPDERQIFCRFKRVHGERSLCKISKLEPAGSFELNAFNLFLILRLPSCVSVGQANNMSMSEVQSSSVLLVRGLSALCGLYEFT
jgi:hypothetical protein